MEPASFPNKTTEDIIKRTLPIAKTTAMIAKKRELKSSTELVIGISYRVIGVSKNTNHVIAATEAAARKAI